MYITTPNQIVSSYDIFNQDDEVKVHMKEEFLRRHSGDSHCKHVYTGTISTIYRNGFFLHYDNISIPLDFDEIERIERVIKISDYTKKGDEGIEQLWEEFLKAPSAFGYLTDNWMQWSKRTPLDDIRYWFHENHSKGVDWLMTCYTPSRKASAFFELKDHIFYEGDFGRAVVFMSKNHYSSEIDFLYRLTENDELVFYYENNACLDAEEKAELESWFMKQIDQKNTPEHHMGL